LHLRGGVKGKIVISYSRVSLPLLSLMYSIYTPLGLNPNHPFPLYSFLTLATNLFSILLKDVLVKDKLNAIDSNKKFIFLLQQISELIEKSSQIYNHEVSRLPCLYLCLLWFLIISSLQKCVRNQLYCF